MMSEKMKGQDFRTALVKNEKGFTLIEILVAIMLLAVALMGMTSVTAMVIKGNSLSKTMTTATTLAKDKMEEFKNTSYADLATVPSPDYVTAGGAVQSSASGTYYKRISTLLSDSPDTGMTSIEVKVEWPQQNPAHNVTLKTIVAEGD